MPTEQQAAEAERNSDELHSDKSSATKLCDVRAMSRTEAVTMPLLPDAELAAKRDDLPDVVRGVIGGEEEFAQIGLIGAVRNRGDELDLRARGEPLERLAVAPELRNRFGPGRAVRRRRRLRPVGVRPLLRLVFRVDAEIEDVGLREPQMFEELPGRYSQPAGTTPRIRGGIPSPRCRIRHAPPPSRETSPAAHATPCHQSSALVPPPDLPAPPADPTYLPHRPTACSRWA